MTAEALKESFIPKYLAVGEAKFYNHLIFLAMLKASSIKDGSYKGTPPEILFMDFYDQFLVLYRQEGEQVYLDMARVFRKAGHKVYRVLLKQKLVKKNVRFLNLVA